MVKRLSGIDALSLHTQSSKAPAHTVSLVIIEASDQLSHQRLQQLVATTLPQMARFRSRLVTKPLGLGQPLWAEIENYDPAEQIYCATVAGPGGQREFAALIADLSSGRHGCRNRLWEAWSINGLAGGRWALAVRMSPALNDGATGAMSLWLRLLTAAAHADPANNLPAEPSLGSAPTVAGLLTDMATEIVENHLAGMWLIAATVSSALQAASARLHRTEDAPATPAATSMSRPVPHTVFNAPLTKRRAVAFASIPMADLKAISNAFGGSITNVVLAACTLSLRAWLQRHDQVPEGPLLMRMPFELPAGDPPRVGGALTVGQLRIPVHLDDPVQVLANLHTATERLNAIRGRDNESMLPAIDLETVASLVPPSMVRVGMQLYNRSGLRQQFKPICHGRVSSVAVEPVPAFLAGAKVVGIHSVAPLAEGSGLSIALTSRGDELDVTVCACPDNVPTVEDIANGMVRSVGTLVAAAQESPRGQGRSVVTEMMSHPANGFRGPTC